MTNEKHVPARPHPPRHLIAGAALLLLASCSPDPSRHEEAAQQRRSDPSCQVGGSARGIAAGFFALALDRPECF